MLKSPKLLQIIGGIAALCLVAYGIFFYSQRRITFVFVEDMKLSPLSKTDIQMLGRNAENCFEGQMRGTLRDYIYATHPPRSEMEKHMVESHIESQAQAMRNRLNERMETAKNIYVAYRGGQVAGHFYCNIDHDKSDGDIIISGVCVDPKQRNSGIGKSLVRHAVAECQKPGRDLFLTIYQKDPKLIEYYSKLGFELTEPKKSLPPDEAYIPMAFMRLKR